MLRPPAGQNSEAPALHGAKCRGGGAVRLVAALARRSARAMLLYHGGRERLKGEYARRETAAGRFSATRGTDSPGRARLWRPRSRPALSGARRLGSNGKRARGLERGTAPRRGAKPCRRNPRSVTGVKQTRKESRGASRRERAKRWGRKVAGVASPRVPNPRFWMRCRGRKPGRVESVLPGIGVGPPVRGPEGACEVVRGVARFDGSWPAVWKGIPERRRDGLPGAPNR